LSGDQAAVFELFDVGQNVLSEADAGHWQLTLEPKDKDLKKLLVRMELLGTEDSLNEIITYQANGQSQLMYLGAQIESPEGQTVVP